MDCDRLTNDHLSVQVARDFGPRIVSFSRPSGRNILAELGDLAIPLPDGRQYQLRGGHRLWAAPEVPEFTYEPDVAPVQLRTSGDTIEVADVGTDQHPLHKMMSVTLRSATVYVTHRLENRGPDPITVAAWAITQLPRGGVALLPLPDEQVDPNGLQPNGEIVLWPYTGLVDSPFRLADRLLVMDCTRSTPTKVGTTLARGWLGYLRDNELFVKRARHDPSARYLDRGASAQIYSNPDFAELETLGPVTTLRQGEAAEHTESWHLYGTEPGADPATVHRLLDLDGGTAP